MVNPQESPPAPASVVYLRLPEPGDAAAAERLAQAVRAAAAVWRNDARVVLDAPDGAAVVGLGDPYLALKAARRAVAGGGLHAGLHHGLVQRVPGAEGEPARLQGEGLDGAALAARQADESLPLETDAFQTALAAARRHGRRRMMIGVVAVAGILGVGVVARLVREGIEAARKPAVISLEIKPSGEVYVDGELKGTSPPLNRMWIPPGAHVIEVRNARFKSLRMEVQLNPGEELEIKHSFASPPRKQGWLERWKFW